MRLSTFSALRRDLEQYGRRVKVKHFVEFESFFETALDHDSGEQLGRFGEIIFRQKILRYCPVKIMFPKKLLWGKSNHKDKEVTPAWLLCYSNQFLHIIPAYEQTVPQITTSSPSHGFYSWSLSLWLYTLEYRNFACYVWTYFSIETPFFLLVDRFLRYLWKDFENQTSTCHFSKEFPCSRENLSTNKKYGMKIQRK
jgi:hypothetical protein